MWSSLIAGEQTNGVIATPARQGHHTSYSVAIKHLTAPPAGRTVIAWLKHPGPPSCTAPSSAITCISAAPAPGPRRTVTCMVRIFQLIPHADGVIVVLRGARHMSSYFIVIKHLPVPQTGRTLIRWLS